jgi:hypothetical protein
VNSNSTEPGDDDHRVLRFRPRGTSGSAQEWRAKRDTTASGPPVENLAKYEGGERDDDYRHRMMVNLAALLFTLLLATAGAWLAVKIADMRKNQDCVLSGRRNCAPIAVQPTERP